MPMNRCFHWSLDLLISGSNKLRGIPENKNERRFQLTAILLDIIPDINLQWRIQNGQKEGA